MLSNKKQDGQVHIVLGDTLKQEAEIVLEKMGLTISEAVKIFLRTVVMEREIPFAVHYSTKIPNYETKKAIEELEAGQGKKVTLSQIRDAWTDD